MLIFQSVLILLVCAVALAALASYLKLPYPSLLALGGTALAFVPNAPELNLDPTLTLALFVAPALLDAAFDTSLRDLKRYWIPVMSLVFIAVGITTFAVAWLLRVMVPDLPWAAAIAVGAIVAPPDAVAASAVMRRLSVPHRIRVIIEGESLLNDATALLVYRLAVSVTMGATVTGTGATLLSLAMIASVFVGFVLAHVIVRVLARVTDAPSAIVLQFVTTFGVWILAEELHLSPIVTLVAYAITAARLSPYRTRAALRLPSYAVWETVVFVLNVLAFVLIGLQLRPILESLEPAQRTNYFQVALAVLGMVIAVRIAWVFIYNRAANLKHRWFGAGWWPGNFVPTIKGSVIVGWAGMRGIVTLATAYALPAGFPHRDLALLCALGVVVGTLVVQGLTLRWLILALGLKDDGTVDREVRSAQDVLALVALEILEVDDSETARVLRDEFVTTEVNDIDAPHATGREARNQLRARIIDAQRQALVRLRDTAEIGDDAFHRIQEQLDRLELVVQ
jgi:CPA1 family monovalent cation:H+ antiporter